MNKEPIKVGDRVIIKSSPYCHHFDGTISKVTEIKEFGSSYVYTLENGTTWRDCYVELYTEPAQTNDNMEEKEYRNLSQDSANYDKMDDKELNLCEILKGHENELFYSPIFGDVYLNAILRQGQTYPISLIAGDKEHYINANGYWDNNYTENTMVVLYPSRESYLKYPLDAKKAWMEWVEEQKPKRWHPKNGEPYWFVNFNTLKSEKSPRSNRGFNWEEDLNHFQTEKEAQQAAEVVKKTLEQFHKENQQ